MANIDDFKKLELRVGQIKEVQDHPYADRLYVLTVDLGDKAKQLVAGIKKSYQKSLKKLALSPLPLALPFVMF